MSELPTDLEREIFEMAFNASERNLALKATLCLVAQRVRAWIDCLFYEQVSIVRESQAKMFLNLIQNNSKPVEFFTVVKKLCLTHAVHRDTACGILAACTQVESLACWIDFGTAVELPLLISKLPLRQLSIGAPNLTKIPTAAPAAWLAGLTHVDLISVAGYTAASISGLARLPHLTHVCLDTYHLGGMEENVTRVCAECPLLRVLVLFEDWSSETPAFLDRTGDIDSRIVVEQKPWDYVEHWINNAEMWATAEETVEEQRARAEKKLTSMAFDE